MVVAVGAVGVGVAGAVAGREIESGKRILIFLLHQHAKSRVFQDKSEFAKQNKKKHKYDDCTRVGTSFIWISCSYSDKCDKDAR